MEILGYLAAILMGLVLGLTGGGGSILTVPILVYLFQTEPLLATSYSLFIVGVTSLIGGIFYFRKGEVDLKMGTIFALPSFVGVYISRHLILPALPDPVLAVSGIVLSKAALVMLVFSVLMLMTSYSMLKSKKVNAEKITSGSQMLIPLQGLLVGLVTGFVGAGGGFLIVPALVMLSGLPMRKAVGTSMFIVAANSLFGFSKDLQQQTPMEWPLLLTIVVIAVVGLFAGVFLSPKISEKQLKRGFGFFVLVMGVVILLDQLFKG